MESNHFKLLEEIKILKIDTGTLLRPVSRFLLFSYKNVMRTSDTEKRLTNKHIHPQLKLKCSYKKKSVDMEIFMENFTFYGPGPLG